MLQRQVLFVANRFPLVFSPLATRHFLLYASLVFSKPRQIDSESALYDAAIKILMRRAHSVHEMKQALERHCQDAALVKNVLARLKSAGYIDDARYAKQFTRHHTESRKQGKFRIARDLRARGVPDRHIEAALEETAGQTDEAALVRQRIARKLRASRGPDAAGVGPRKTIDDRKLASLYRSLLRSGFSADVIRRELKSVTREDVSEVDPGSDP
ncbi:MAG TPA: regulatory protein RecX [Candidatus Acidoferrum sp.]|nr:regulatory protein RecX [Candidatus Acidoferrum sp.]